MRATFHGCRWSAKVTQPCRVTALWLAKSRTSKSAEVRDIWDIYDQILQFILGDEAGDIDDALVGGNPHLAWEFWSAAAERALVAAFRMSGGPIPPKALGVGLVLVVRVYVGIDQVWLVLWMLLKFISIVVNQLPPC